MVVTSLGFVMYGVEGVWRWLSRRQLCSFHPLVALPGLLLLISLWVPNHIALIGALLGLLLTLAIAVVAAASPWLSPPLTLMDPSWLDTVQERSQFLFLQLWSFRDWELNVRPFFYLAFTAMAIQDERIRKLCVAPRYRGRRRLGSSSGRQPDWPRGFTGSRTSVALGMDFGFCCAFCCFRRPFCKSGKTRNAGLLCAVLLVSGWTLSAVDATACVSLAILLWVMRERINVRRTVFFRWVAVALASAIIGWMLLQIFRILGWSAGTLSFGWLRVLPSISEIRSIFDLRISAALAVALVFWSLRKNRSQWHTILLAAVLLASTIALLPSAFKQSRIFGASADIDEFADWRRAIPPASTVLLVPARDVGSFVWFTLQRPNYLSVDQSAGVVFSRATALEVRRRSNALLPVMDPDWKIRTRLRDNVATKRSASMVSRPLTSENWNRYATTRCLAS